MPDAWQGWKPLGTEMFSPGTQLAAVVRKKRIPFPPERDQWGLPIDPDTIIPHVHVLAVDMNQNLRDFWYEGNEPRGWFQAGSETFNQGTSTAAVSREPESVDIWAVRPNGMLYYDQAVGSGWTGWNRIDQDNMQIAPPADVAAVSRADGFLDVFYIRGGFVQTNSLRDGTWQGQVPLAWTFVA
jgi:hypothetical protein